MVLKLAHIVNPVAVGKESDLYAAQPITFESMRRARNAASPELGVSLYAAQYIEDWAAVPDDFEKTPDLRHSVLDVKDFKIRRKLPFLREILDRLYQASNADYLIYTNVDIGLQPNFYAAVQSFIESGYESFVINRRTVSARYNTVDDLEAIYGDEGSAHPGWDCFVFPRALFPRFVLGDACVGAGRVGLVLLANLVAFSDHFCEFGDEHLTFHIGDARTWRGGELAEYYAHNTAVLMRVLTHLEDERGLFARDSIPGRFLARKRRFGVLYDFWSQHVYWHEPLSRLRSALRRGK